MSLCASTSAVSVAKTPSSCAAVRSRNWSKLPRRVLPSIAELVPPGLVPSGLVPSGLVPPGLVPPGLAQAACNRLA